MRLFFAIMLPPDVQASIYRLRQQLAWLPIRPSYTAQENLHITLKFLGEVGDAEVAALASQVTDAAHLSGPLRLRPDHVVMFPPEGSARVLGVGFCGDVEAVCRLQAELEKVCQGRGLPAENRAYTPHATVARFRDGLHGRHRTRVEESWRELAALPEFVVYSFQLMQSVLGPEGSRYIVVARYGGGGSDQ